jgi:hypothetical protein
VPTIVTRGVASARGAGTFSAAPPPPPPPPPTPTPPPPSPPSVFQTVTFNSSGVWTAPAGVSTIINLQVAGGLYSDDPGGFGDETIPAVTYTASFDSPGSSSGQSYENATSYANAVLRSFNSGGTGDRSVLYQTLALFWNSSTGGYYYYFEPAVTLRINSVAERVSGPWDNNSPALVGGPTQPPTAWNIGVRSFIPSEGEVPGTPSSAFGYTAAGTTSAGQPRVITNVGAVSVSPGQQYNIQVGTLGGYVTFQFSQS